MRLIFVFISFFCKSLGGKNTFTRLLLKLMFSAEHEAFSATNLDNLPEQQRKKKKRCYPLLKAVSNLVFSSILFFKFEMTAQER